MDIDFINNPHDKFFKETFTQKDNAVSFLKNYLPEDIQELINPEEIKIEKDSFISEELKECFSDILYRVDFKEKEGYIYTLFEHKSNPDVNTGLQLLEYMVKIWQAKKSQKEQLPVIIPLVVYHGQDSWNIATQFSDMLELPADNLLQYTPDFTYILHDLSQYDDQDIIGTDELRARLKVMKHIKDHIENLLRQYAEEQRLSQLPSAAIYIFTVRDETIDEIIQKIIEINNQGVQVMKTTAEQLIEEGKKEGKKEGINIDTIHKVTGLSLEDIKSLKQK